MGTKDRGCAGGYVKDLFHGKKRKGGGRETMESREFLSTKQLEERRKT